MRQKCIRRTSHEARAGISLSISILFPINSADERTSIALLNMTQEEYDEWCNKMQFIDLPCASLPAEIVDQLHPWIAGFVTLDSKAAQDRLAKRWKSIKTPELQVLRDQLLTFSTTGLVLNYENGGVISALRPGTTGDRIGDQWFLPPPLDPAYVNERFKTIGFEPPLGVEEFFVNFGGLSENTYESGSFRYTEDFWPIFGDDETSMRLYYMPWSEWIHDFKEWYGSLMLYFSLNGSKVLLQKDGTVGWWILQERRVQKIADSFPEFILLYADHWKVSWPFDPYGAP